MILNLWQLSGEYDKTHLTITLQEWMKSKSHIGSLAKNWL
jgi:hypothetical protein